MILHHIRLANFLVYAGEQTLELAAPSAGQRGVSVVVAPNNSGKTSILRALRFWFYGQAGIDGPASQFPQLINNHLRDKTPVGGTASASVEVDFEVESTGKSIRVTLRRTLEVKRRGEAKWDVVDVKLQRVVHGPKFKLEDDAGDKWQRQLNAIMPRPLFGAFFFMGEPLDGQLLQSVDKIRDSLGQFLHEDQWREAEQAATQVRDRLGRSLKKLSESDIQLKGKLTALTTNQAALDQQREELEEAEQQLAAVEQDMEEAGKRLQQLGDTKEADHWKGLLDQAKRRAVAARQTLHQLDAEVADEVRRASGLPFLTGAIEPVRKILQQMRDENILPADISPGFVDRVVKADQCLCRRDHTDQTRSAWEAYKRKTLEVDVSEGLRKLLDWVDDRHPLSVEARSRKAGAKFDDLLERRREAVKQLNEAEAAAQEAEAGLATLPHEEIQAIISRLNRGREQQQQLANRVRTFTHLVKNAEATVTMFQREIREIRRKSSVDLRQYDQVQAAYERADKLAAALKDCRSRLTPYFRSQLQAAVTSSYDTPATDGSQAHIDAATLIPSIRVNGQATRNLGGGQSQLLALSYVVALARLRQDMHWGSVFLSMNRSTTSAKQ